MPKSQVKYICSSCGTESLKWMGKCSGCGEWNTMEEFQGMAEFGDLEKKKNYNAEQVVKSIVDIKDESRLASGIGEFDRVLGGGLVKGEVVLIGGAPGVGKSTLLLSIASRYLQNGQKVLYFSGEESAYQISGRAKRLFDTDSVVNKELKLVSSNDTDLAATLIQQEGFDVVIVDSIQSVGTSDVSSLAGSISQVRESAVRLSSAAKKSDTSLILVGQVNKEGNLAGPMMLSHIVDAVFSLEGNDGSELRLLRSLKNRFGATDEVGLFLMGEKGMEEILDVSKLYSSSPDSHAPGIAKGVLLEGKRPIIVDIQALVVKTDFSMPRRVANGFNANRLHMLLAVLQKKLGLKISGYDVFVNVAGGFKIDDPALDLPLCAAIISAFKDKEIKENTVLVGEVGLTGEIRSVINESLRLKESFKLGIENAVVSGSSKNRKSKRVTSIPQLPAAIF